MLFAFYFLLFTNVKKKKKKIKFQISKFKKRKEKRMNERKIGSDQYGEKKKWWDYFLILFYLKSS
jgi:hypothetical protein